MNVTSRCPPKDKLKDIALTAAHEAGKQLMKYFQKSFSIKEKKDAGFVTAADLAAEKVAIKTLQAETPMFGILAEEAGSYNLNSEGLWIIDPLDGTTNFSKGLPIFSVSIAATWRGELIAGVVYHPVVNDSYVAVKGRGAFCNGKKIHVSKTKKISNAMLATGFSYRSEKFFKKEIKTFHKQVGASSEIRRMGSAALDLAFTARGAFDGFWERDLSPWDMAAGVLLVLEAGGRVSDFSGGAFDLNKREVLASNSYIHTELLKRM